MTILQVKEVSLSHGDRKILSGINLEVHPGEVIGLVGPNGSGKSTLLKALSGVLPFDSGAVYLDSKNLLHLDPRSRSRIVTYVGSEFDSDFPITALEAVKLGDYPRAFALQESGEEKLESVMRELGAWEYRDRKIHSLSSGERQRVALARAFYQNPRVVFLDESVTQLDLHHQSRISEILRKHSKAGMSFVLVSHDLNYTINSTDRLVLLRGGSIVDDGATQSVLTEKNLKALYPDAEFDFSNHPRTGNRLVHFRSSSET